MKVIVRAYGLPVAEAFPYAYAVLMKGRVEGVYEPVTVYSAKDGSEVQVVARHNRKSDTFSVYAEGWQK